MTYTEHAGLNDINWHQDIGCIQTRVGNQALQEIICGHAAHTDPLLTPALKRIARHFDGWFPIDTPPATWADRRQEIDVLAAADGRDPSGIAGALYLTLSISEDEEKAGARLDAFLASYYGARPDVLKKRQACYAGPAAGAAALMQAYANAGVEHFCLRFAGDHEASLEIFAKVRKDLGW